MIQVCVHHFTHHKTPISGRMCVILVIRFEAFTCTSDIYQLKHSSIHSTDFILKYVCAQLGITRGKGEDLCFLLAFAQIHVMM